MLTHRLAQESDLPALSALASRSIGEMQKDFLSPAQIQASHLVMGIDTQLITDRTYFAVFREDVLVGCGGWSRRATLYGGNHTLDQRNPALLDPQTDAARVRAMYTHPDYARQGIGRLILGVCERAALNEGFSRLELMATLAGMPLYRSSGFVVIEEVFAETGLGLNVPLLRMGKAIG